MMALTEKQKTTLGEVKEKIEEWKAEQLEQIDREFIFLNSLSFAESALSGLVVSELVDQVVEDIKSLQLFGEAYEDDGD